MMSSLYGIRVTVIEDRLKDTKLCTCRTSLSRVGRQRARNYTFTLCEDVRILSTTEQPGVKAPSVLSINMPFETGNKLGKGGVRPGAGHKTNFERRIHEAAEDIARQYIENHVLPVLKNVFPIGPRSQSQAIETQRLGKFFGPNGLRASEQ